MGEQKSWSIVRPHRFLSICASGDCRRGRINNKEPLGMPTSISMSACARGGYVAVLSDISFSADPWGDHSVPKFFLLENLSLKGKIKQ